MTKILLAEDDQVIREQLAQRLQGRAYEVLTAADGFTAVTTAQIEQPALILVDTRLPGINGWQVAEQLKSSAYTRHIPIIALTVPAYQDDVHRCMAAGCNATFAKPTQWTQLLTQIEAMLPNGQIA